MDINNSEVPTLSDLLEEIKKLREDVGRHERLLENIVTFNQQHGMSVLPTWSPAQEITCPTQQDVAIKVVRLIERQSDKSHDSLTKLKETWLGRLYINKLKNYALIRSFTIFIWRKAYPLYINHLASPFSLGGADRRYRPLTKLKEFSRRNRISTLKIVDASFVKTPHPEVFPEKDKTYLVAPHERYDFPEVYVSEIINGTVYGGTNLVLAEDEVICHDLYDFKRDFTSEELHGRTLIDPKHNRIRWLLLDKEPEVIPAVATFVDACAPNYAHWLTEVLPRVATFCNDSRFEGIPIVVNEGLHKNIMESLGLVVGTGREIIALPIGRALTANTLFVTSVVGYVPFDRRNKKFSKYSHGLFHPTSLALVKDKIDISTANISNEGFPEKIYLRRNSGSRKVVNGSEIEKYFLSIGYAIVEPEKLSFTLQAKLFGNAKSIVGSSGAAMANLVFAEKDAKIFIFISKFKDTSYWYWQNIACATGKEIRYILGQSLQEGIHSDFSIDITDLPLIFEEEKRWRPLTRLKEFSKRNKISTLKIVDASFVKTPHPEVFPEKDYTYLVAPHESYDFPEVYVSEIINGTVYGGTNLVLAEDEVICHDLYDFKRDLTSEELHARALIDPKHNRIRWLLHDKEPEVIPAIATFVDACAPNYAHWLTEVLPRVATFCNDNRFEGIPIVVNGGLHKNIMESLALVVGTGREIIALPVGRALTANTLFVTSVVGYVPFERRNNKLSEYSHGLFNPTSLALVKEKIDISTANISIEGFPEKIYLRRNSGARKIVNGREIETYFQSIGYAMVEPEKLSFAEQVKLFGNAKVIVGSAGAAMANLIFAQEGTNIFIFISKMKDTSYWYWQNIACATGKKIKYILGDPLQEGIHSDFSIGVTYFPSIFEQQMLDD